VIARAETFLERPCDEVYAIVAGRVFESFHLWNTGVVEIRPLSATRAVVVSYQRRGRSGYHEEGSLVEVLKAVEPRELVIETSDPHPVLERSRVTLLFEPVKGATRLRATEELIWGNDWLGFARPIIWMKRSRQLRSNLRRLRAAIESGKLPPPPTSRVL
jgi:uncharacterized protein YndB with AHSA1/START domain